MDAVALTPGGLGLAELRRIYRAAAPLRLPADWQARLRAARAVVERVVAEGRPVYGVNTGVGKLAQTRIAAAYRALLEGSPLNASHQGPDCDRVQDP